MKEVYTLKCDQFNLDIVGKMLFVKGRVLYLFKHTDSETEFFDSNSAFAFYELHTMCKLLHLSIPCSPCLYIIAVL